MKDKSELSRETFFRHKYWGLCAVSELETTNTEPTTAYMIFRKGGPTRVPIAILEAEDVDSIQSYDGLKSSMTEFMELLENLKGGENEAG